MSPTVVRTNDPCDLRRQQRQGVKIGAIAMLAHIFVAAVFLIWKGGLIGLAVLAILAMVTSIWAWADAAIARIRMRKRLRKASEQPATGDGSLSWPRVDSWLLVNGSLGVGFDQQGRNLYVFKGKKVLGAFHADELRRIAIQRRRRLFGGDREILFISDEYAGPGLELRVTEGNAQDFVRLVDASRQSQERGPLMLAANA